MSDLSEEGEDLATVEAAVESDLDALQRERDDYLDTLRRLQADFDNYRKRTLKQQTDMLERAARGIVEKLLRENGDKIDAGERAKVETAVGALKDSLAGSDVDAIKRGTENLMQVSQGFAQRLYEAASQQQSSAGPSSSDGGSQAARDDEVVDAEIVDEGTG